MLQKNGIDFTKIGEPARENEQRPTTDWVPGKNRFITVNTDKNSNDCFPFGHNNTITTDFCHQNQQWFCARKGTRPNARLLKRVEGTWNRIDGEWTTPDNYWLIKFSDGSVWLSYTDVPYTSTPSGILIASADLDLQYVVAEFQGGGSGGVGGSAGAAGSGGGSGALVLCSINLVHNATNYCGQNSIPLQISKNATGSSNRSDSQRGKVTGLQEPDSWTQDNPPQYRFGAGGGTSAKNYPGKGGTLIDTKNTTEVFHVIQSFNGIDGGEGGGNWVSRCTSPAITTTTFAPINELGTISHPEYTHDNWHWAGNGGCSPFGIGGKGADTVGDRGFDSTSFGGGGGGGARKNAGSTYGGFGGPGCIQFYY